MFLRGPNKVTSSASRALVGIFREGSICARELREHLRDSGAEITNLEFQQNEGKSFLHLLFPLLTLCVLHQGHPQ